MKKLFSLVCAVVLAVSAQAQLVTSRSRSMVEAPKEDRTMWVLRLGVGSNKFAGDEYYEDDKSKAGYWFSMEFNKSMGQRGAYWGMDFALTSRGWKYEDDGEEWKMAAHTFQWSPFIFGWKVKVPNSKFSIDPHIGVYAAVDYAGKFTYDDGDGHESDTKIGDYDGYNRFDAGLKAGVGVWYDNRWNLDFTYQRGFLSYDDDLDGGASNFWVRLGMGF